jgi:hypothetical protein
VVQETLHKEVTVELQIEGGDKNHNKYNNIAKNEVKGDSEFILNKFVAQEDHRRFDRKCNFADI